MTRSEINCRDKRWFGSRVSAKKFERKGRRLFKDGSDKQWPYKCKVCGGFHLTSLPRHRWVYHREFMAHETV